MTKDIIDVIIDNAIQRHLEPATCLAIFDVETGGVGFDKNTGKILIQFEPVWYKRLSPYTPSGKWSVNKIERQEKEWLAFNDAFAKNPEAAMQATSIGMPQILGLHYKRLGFKSVGAFWDFMKASLTNQITMLFKFIETDSKLLNAVKSKDFDMIARRFNGEKYKELADSIPREHYDISLSKSRQKWLKTLKHS
jgi:hypothetical protein